MNNDLVIRDISGKMVHDISTPLTAIKSFSTLINECLPILLKTYEDAIKKGEKAEAIPIESKILLKKVFGICKESEHAEKTVNDFWEKINALIPARANFYGQNIPVHEKSSPVKEIKKKKDINFKPTVLLADDEHFILEITGEILESMGCIVDLVKDGKEAVDRVKAKPYNLILMDCFMPNLDGFEATTLIRQQEQDSGKHIPIVGVTASPLEEDQRRGILSGMDDFIVKPLSGKTIQNILKRFTT